MNPIYTLMQEIAALAETRKEIETREKMLRGQLLGEMNRLGIKKEANEHGSFTIKPYTKWTYSDTVSAMEDDLKLRKQDEQEQGVATAEVTESVTFVPFKTKDNA